MNNNNKLLIGGIGIGALALGLVIGGTARKAPEDALASAPDAVADTAGVSSRTAQPAQVASNRPVKSASSQRSSGIFTPRSLTVPQGTPIRVRLNSAVSTKTHQSGDGFTATLADPIYVNDKLIAPAGANVEGVVASATSGGRVKGVASLGVRLTEIDTRSGDVRIATNTVYRQANATKKKDAAKIGIGSGIGAAIGAIAGGGKGAAIGAGAGAAGGTGWVLTTKGDSAVISSESLLTFQLAQPVDVRPAS